MKQKAVPIIYLFIYSFIHLQLCWVFVAVRGLSLVVASGGYSSLRSTGSRWASVVVAHGLQQLWLAGSRAQAQ